MRYRKLSPTGDYTFGQSAANFYVDEPAAVGQSVQTRMGLWQGQWYINLQEGTPIAQSVLGYGSSYDLVIQERILQTSGVSSIESYLSSVDPVTREWSWSAEVLTIYDTTSTVGVTGGNGNVVIM